MAGLLNYDYSQTAASQIQPVQRQVTPDELAQNQLANITNKDSPLMQLAGTQGKQYAASRGLLDSSIGAGAAQASMIDKATPFALQDASRYGMVADKNLDWQNEFGMADKRIGADYDQLRLGHQWQSGENVLDRTHQSSMQQAEFGFRGSQNELDRALQKYLQSSNQTWQSGESDKDRSFQKMMQDYELGWRSGEASLDRALQQTLQESQFAFQGSQAEIDRQFQMSMQSAEFGFKGTQAELDRALQTYLQSTDQDWRSGESDKDKQFQEMLQAAEQGWRSGEADLDRALQQTLESQKQQWGSTENQLDRAARVQEQNTAIQANADLAAKSFQQDLQKMGYAFDLDKYGVSSNFAANTMQNTLNRIMDIQANPEIDPEAKRNAIQNIVDSTNETLAWASTFYQTPMPTATTPDDNPGIIQPNTSYSSTGPTAPSTFDRDAMSKYMTSLAQSYGYQPNVDEIENAIREAERNGWTNEQAEAWVIEQLKANGTIQ
jgi:hypothetical protein